ncbi:hypothetical protein B0H14DRAFT_3603375 [Mycena olivaceomarginata]|nr:hypothetical protein B0H14DRAFT_3603375 [Mycena olivaceomarginata]
MPDFLIKYDDRPKSKSLPVRGTLFPTKSEALLRHWIAWACVNMALFLLPSSIIYATIHLFGACLGLGADPAPQQMAYCMAYFSCVTGAALLFIATIFFPRFFRYHLIVPLILGRPRHRSHFSFISQRRAKPAYRESEFSIFILGLSRLGASCRSLPLCVSKDTTVDEVYRKLAALGLVPNTRHYLLYFLHCGRRTSWNDTMRSLEVGPLSQLELRARFLGGVDDAAAITLWQKDEHVVGKATCPDCGLLLGYGPGGVQNLEDKHRGSQNCINARRRRDKRPLKDGSMHSFFKPKVPAVPPTIQSPAPFVFGSSTSSALEGNSTPVPVATSAVPSTAPPQLLQLLDQLREHCTRLPSTVPGADESSPLAVFSNDPESYVSNSTAPGELWEELQSVFHGAFDYGKGLEEREKMVQTGPQGLGGFLRFMEYFIVTRGLSGGMVELKLEQVLDAVKSVFVHLMHPNLATDLSHRLKKSGAIVEPIQDHLVIDVDDDSNLPTPVDTSSQDAPAPTPSKQLSPCTGFVFPKGLNYPFGLHELLSVPWGCRPCADLVKESSLDGILKRADEGMPERANYAYYSPSGLIEILRRKNKQIEELRLRGLKVASRIITQARSLSDYKRLVRAIGSGAVERVDRVVGIALGRKRGARGILRAYEDAGRGIYHPKSYTEEDDMRAMLIWKLAGNRVADIVHRSLGLPSRSTLRTREIVPPLPEASEVAENVQACFESITEVIAAKKVVHQILMYDEIATEKRIRWDHKTNKFLGVCREHAHEVDLHFNSENDLEELFRALPKPNTPLKEAKLHYAGEATVAALGILSDETRLYAARPVLVSGDCKIESGVEHVHNVLNPTIDGVNSKRELTKLRTVSLVSDGETRRAKAFIEKTFLRQLSPASNIYSLLKNLPLMNFWVGDDDITADKDWKHVFKRGRNLLLRKSGLDIMGIHSAGHSTTHINSLFNPEDKQNVTLAFKLLQDIWSLPLPLDTASPGFRAQRHALRLTGSLFYHLLFPYICVDLTLSEQLEHLSAAAHIALILYRDGGKRSLPTLLFVDIMLKIKNAYFCVAKAKVDDPTGKFWLILLGTDRLEELFGILRTMIGNDANLDVLQLAGRLTGTTQVANILAKYPHWDRAPRRLNLPALTRDSTELSDKTDHIKPPSWRGDVSVENVTLLTCWNRGRRQVEDEFVSLSDAFRSLDAASDVDILSPHGTLLVRVDLDPDDIEEDTEPEAPTSTTSLSPALEDAVVDEEAPRAETAEKSKVNHFITVNNKPQNKTRALSLMQKYSHKAISTDRLKRVAAVDRYSSTSDGHDDLSPIVTLVHSEDKLFVCVGEVTDIRVNGTSVDQLGLDVLHEPGVIVDFQIVCVVPATAEDDPDLKHDWRARGPIRGQPLSTPGRLTLPIDPTLSTRTIGGSYYLFESSVLRAFGAQLLDTVTLHLNKSIPKFTPTDAFPYREVNGRACFVCEVDDEMQSLLETDSHVCPKCTPSLPLDMEHPQTILAHIGAHILYDPTVLRSTQPCGLCCRPWPMCQFFLKKSRSAGRPLTLDMDRSRGCPNLVHFSYSTAEISKDSSPCSNAPIKCSHCNPKDPAVWRYFFKEHLIEHHPGVSLMQYSHIWQLSAEEEAAMRKIWDTRGKRKKPRKVKSSLIISEAHSSRRVLAYADTVRFVLLSYHHYF